MLSLQNEVIYDIQKAKQHIQVAVAWLTDITLLDALINKISFRKDMKIEIIISNHSNNQEDYLKPKYLELINLGAKIKIYGSKTPEEGNFLHCKFYIIDDTFAKSGSFNWSKAARENIECLDEVDCNAKIKLFDKLFKRSNDYVRIVAK